MQGNGLTIILAAISLLAPLLWGAITLWTRKTSTDEAKKLFTESIKGELAEFKAALLAEMRSPTGFKPSAECALIEERNVSRLIKLETMIDLTGKRLEDLWLYSHTRIHDSAQILTALSVKLDLEVKRLEQLVSAQTQEAAQSTNALSVKLDLEIKRLEAAFIFSCSREQMAKEKD